MRSPCFMKSETGPSLDMDFSIVSQLPDLAIAKTRIFSALRCEFADIGYVVFDESSCQLCSSFRTSYG
jgi:hypothetical protein